MQRQGNTQRILLGICQDCGKYVSIRLIPGVLASCPHCAGFDVVALQVVRVEEAQG